MATVPASHGGYPGGYAAPTTIYTNIAGNGGISNIVVGHGISNVPNEVSQKDTSQKFPTMLWVASNGDIDITFHEVEDGAWVKAALAAAYDMTPRESMTIQLLITGAIGGRTNALPQVKPLTFIRKHGLERHFNISLA